MFRIHFSAVLFVECFDFSAHGFEIPSVEVVRLACCALDVFNHTVKDGIVCYLCFLVAVTFACQYSQIVMLSFYDVTEQWLCITFVCFQQKLKAMNVVLGFLYSVVVDFLFPLFPPSQPFVCPALDGDAAVLVVGEDVCVGWDVVVTLSALHTQHQFCNQRIRGLVAFFLD